MTQTWDDQYRQGKGLRYWPCEELIRFLGRRWPDRKAAGWVLDIGSGTGNNTWALLEWGFRVAMTEPSKEARTIAAEYLSQRGFPKENTYHGKHWAVSIHSIFDWSHGGQFGVNFYDGAIDIMTSQHFSRDDHLVAYKEVRRLLKPSAWFFLYHLGSQTKGYDAIFPGSPWASLPSKYALKRCLAQAGFRVVNVSQVSRRYDRLRIAQYWSVEAEAV